MNSWLFCPVVLFLFLMLSTACYINIMRKSYSYPHFKKVFDIPRWHLRWVANLLCLRIPLVVRLRACRLGISGHGDLLLLHLRMIILRWTRLLLLLIIWIWSISPEKPIRLGGWWKLLLLRCNWLLLLLLLHHQLRSSRLLLLLWLSWWAIYIIFW
jgi:hypothetical protein